MHLTPAVQKSSIDKNVFTHSFKQKKNNHIKNHITSFSTAASFLKRQSESVILSPEIKRA